MDDEEFNRYIVGKRKEIDSLDVSDEERKRLYELVEETIEIRNEGAVHQASIKRRDYALKELNGAVGKVLSLQEKVERSNSLFGWVSGQQD